MSTICDDQTIEILRRIVGMRLERVVARRYPGVLAYSQVIVTFADGFSILIDLEDKTISPNFEVFVVQAKSVKPPSELLEWDRFELGDFIVGSVFLLRREEWVEKPTSVTYGFSGQHHMEQKFGVVGDGNDQRQAVTVDSGISFVSTYGAELSLDADPFPLVFQLSYVVASSQLPLGFRVPITEYVSRQ